MERVTWSLAQNTYFDAVTGRLDSERSLVITWDKHLNIATAVSDHNHGFIAVDYGSFSLAPVKILLTCPKAHDHARAAYSATQNADTTVAIDEHAQAAGEFAKAAVGTGSAEALRTLKLLEQHHQKLSELLRYPSEHPVSTTTSESEVQAGLEKPISTSAAVAELRASKSDIGPRSSSPLRTPPSLQSPHRRLPPRDLSSSIASNLASARGIRSNYTRQPLSPSVSTHQAPGNLETLQRKDGKRPRVPESIPENATNRPSWVPPTQAHQKADAQTSMSRESAIAESTSPAPNDEGFSRFYNAFENILHKLSAPLAFAGLPLAPEERSEVSSLPEPRHHSKKGSQGSATEPDLTKYISRAALQASARDGHSGNDSFYVVPTSGHSVSYAHILSFAEKEKRRLAASMHTENPDMFSIPTEEDDFVDALETPMPPSPTKKRNSKKLGPRDIENKVEELTMENKSLKDCVDKLSTRLRAFEMAAQSNSLALHESMRLMRPVSPAREPSFTSAGASNEALQRRVLELEDQVAAGRMDLTKLAKKNDRLNSSLTQYRDKWEQLKKGAKSRNESRSANAKDGKDGQSGKDGDSAVPRLV